MSGSESTSELRELIEQLKEDRREQKELIEELRGERKEQKELMVKLVRTQNKQLERTVFYGESLLERANWIEWRDALRFESEWSAQSLQASYKCWKLKVLNTPSRNGDDRDGLRGSPWCKSDERKADLELPDERLAERLADFPERLWRELGIDAEQWSLDRLAQVLQKQRRDLDFEQEKKRSRAMRARASQSSSLEPIGEQAEQEREPEEQARPDEVPEASSERLEPEEQGQPGEQAEQKA